MEALNNERKNILLKIEDQDGNAWNIHIDYFDNDELIKAIITGAQIMGLYQKTIFVTTSQPHYRTKLDEHHGVNES